MRVLFAGPLETAALRRSAKVTLAGAPENTRGIPLVPLTTELLSRGHQVTIVTLVMNLERRIRIDEGDLTVIYLPQRYRARALASNLFEPEIRALTREIREQSCDIVHAHWTYEFAEAAVRAGKPHLVTMHDVPIDIFWIFKDPYRFARLLMALRTMPRIQALSVVSPLMLPWLKYHGYFKPARVIPNAIEWKDVAATTRPADGPPVLVTIGDLTRRKNVRTGIDAFRIVRAAFPDATLHLFGESMNERFIGYEPGVIGHGNVPHRDLMKFLAEKATLLVHPSIQESFGLIIAEAIVRGVPAIAGARAGGPAFVVGEENADLLTDVTNPATLGERILRAINKPNETARLQAGAYDRITQLFDAAHIVDQYIAEYQKARSH